MSYSKGGPQTPSFPGNSACFPDPSRQSREAPQAAESNLRNNSSSANQIMAKQIKSTTLWSSFFLSNWFFIWLFPLALKFFRKDPIEKIPLALREKSDWTEGRLLQSLITVYGREYAYLGIYKALSFSFLLFLSLFGEFSPGSRHTIS